MFLSLAWILIELGVDVRYNFRQKILYLHAAKITNNIVSQKASHIRASYYLWGSLLARFRYTKEFDSLKVYVPGGCSFGGKRPTDFHEDLIRSVLGASIEEENSDKGNYLIFTCPVKIRKPFARFIPRCGFLTAQPFTGFWPLPARRTLK